mmetsp:Transcript_53193/g.88188  ORF Transcript_53193/g.88188 Transcript_53193/m.88188 type:complete len:143 (-) Transcript_53193:75-503(-)|eukprot:CAMPEP_0202686422 /NCGR_PEP_ID=MMETSP1385-20130828/2213_1 /ASSEMBLY_ACC=CAM_ASM_000861 /TAXON_ID=933848 /ORGANISM="Elphidium margaritaceum" /LENGTH=142 /DNA_ID=CAMNT_0049340993 /DNA_START=104 /DNA_END=532 /DNA_ORIENTATION=+
MSTSTSAVNAPHDSNHNDSDAAAMKAADAANSDHNPDIMAGATDTVDVAAVDNGTSDDSAALQQRALDDIEKTKRIQYSSMKSDENPLTLARQKATQEGRPLCVAFDERVVVHTVPYWDPCGETYYDSGEHAQRGPNCCVLL